MEFFSGLDVSIVETAICVVDDKGKVHLQTSVATDGEAIMQALKPFLQACGVSAMKQARCRRGCILNSSNEGFQPCV